VTLLRPELQGVKVNNLSPNPQTPSIRCSSEWKRAFLTFGASLYTHRQQPQRATETTHNKNNTPLNLKLTRTQLTHPRHCR
jgi:hypothetical protein